MACWRCGPALSSLWFAYVEIVIAPAAGEAPPPRDVPHSVALIPLRLVPIVALWLLPLLVAACCALLAGPLRARRQRLRPRTLMILLAAVICLLAVASWGVVHIPDVASRLAPVNDAAQLALQKLVRRLGFQYYNLAPLLSFLDGIFANANAGFLPVYGNAVLGAGMVPVDIAVGGLFLLGLLASLPLRTPVQAVLVLLAVPMLSLYTVDLHYPQDLMRTTAVPFLFLALALVSRERPAEDVTISQQFRKPRVTFLLSSRLDT